MFVIQKHSGSVRLKGRNVTTPHLSEKHDLSHLTVSSPCDVLLVQKSFEPFEVILSMLLFDMTQQTIFP